MNRQSQESCITPPSSEIADEAINNVEEPRLIEANTLQTLCPGVVLSSVVLNEINGYELDVTVPPGEFFCRETAVSFSRTGVPADFDIRVSSTNYSRGILIQFFSSEGCCFELAVNSTEHLINHIT